MPLDHPSHLARAVRFAASSSTAVDHLKPSPRRFEPASRQHFGDFLAFLPSCSRAAAAFLAGKRRVSRECLPPGIIAAMPARPSGRSLLLPGRSQQVSATGSDVRMSLGVPRAGCSRR